MTKREIFKKFASVFVKAKKEKPTIARRGPSNLEEGDPYLGNIYIANKDIVRGHFKAVPGDKVKGIFEGDVEEHRIEKTRKGDKVTIGLRIKKLLIK